MAAVLQLFTRLNRWRARSTALSIKTSPKHEFVDHTDIIYSIVFLQDNAHIVSGSYDGTMCKWDCETGLLVGEPWDAKGPVTALALSPDGKVIACGMDDGSVQRWDTGGQMMEGIWTGHRDWVGALSWSPSGHHLASGSGDGTILIRNAESGQVEVGPINANQGKVYSVAYSPSGDRIASGGDNISIWDSHTGELRVGPIQASVYSILWSLDGSRLYCDGDVARVLDSASGTELHRFQYDNWLFSIALSPQHNLLAGVGSGNIVQLWDAESYQSLGQPFYGDTSEDHFSVSFSPDGRYLAYGGQDAKITLRIVKDSTSELPVLATNPQDGTQQEAMPESQSSSNHNVDATNPLAQSAIDDNEAPKDLYKDNFFTGTSSPSSPPSPSPNPSHKRRWRVILSPRHGRSTKESGRLKARLSSRRVLSHSPLRAPAHGDLETEATSRAKSKCTNHEKRVDVDHPGDAALGTAERGHDKGKQREKSSAPDAPSFPDELDNRDNRILWKSIFHARKKGRKEVPAEALTQGPSPAVAEVYARRWSPGYAVLTSPKRKKNLVAGVPSTSTPVHVGGSPQPGPSSFSDPMTMANTTYDDTDSDWRIEGRWNTFLDRICYPCGH